jgi:hypothetical protein
MSATTAIRYSDVEQEAWAHLMTRGALRAPQSCLGETLDGTYCVHAYHGTGIAVVRSRSAVTDTSTVAAILDHDEAGRIVRSWWMRPWSVWTDANQRGRILGAATTLLQAHAATS